VKRIDLAILYGGRSGEHEVSIRSAKAIMSALNAERYNIVEYLISKEGKWSPKPILPEPGGNPGIDVVFPVLHGTFGEDGTVQGLLELADLPYVGPGVLGSAASMDKEVTKRLCREAGLPVGDYMVVDPTRVPFDELESRLGYPMFVKPANLGSSVGISKAKNRAELGAAISTAGEFDRKVIVERTIAGQEIECSVLGNEEAQASIPCEILPSREFYDYDDKYLLDKSETRIPAGLSSEQIEEVRRLAVACFRTMQCDGMARVDFLVEKASGKIYINEINTIPGFTSISMYPKMWDYCGLPFSDLIDCLVDLAIARHKSRQALRYSR
jgi:D-alanine-D-alanine ligase